MRATISQSNLSKLLSSVSQYGNKAPTGTDIVIYALLKAEGNKISISGTNLETETTTIVSATIKAGGQILVPIKKVSDLVESLPNIDIKLSTTKNNKLRLSWGNSATIAIRDVEDFPAITTFDENNSSTISINTEVLRLALPQIAFAASQDDSRPILKGACWNNILQSADGYRASFVEINTPNDITIPAKPLGDELHKLLCGDKVEVQNSRTKVVFKMEDGTIFTSNSLEGTFPQIDQFLDFETELRLVFDTKQLLSVMRQAEVFDSSGTGLVVIASNDGFDVSIQSENDEFQASIPAIETKGDKQIKFGLSTRYFSSSKSGVLPRMNSELVEIHLAGNGDNPIIIKNTIRDKDTIKSGNFTHVIMPVKLRNENVKVVTNQDYKAEEY